MFVPYSERARIKAMRAGAHTAPGIPTSLVVAALVLPLIPPLALYVLCLIVIGIGK